MKPIVIFGAGAFAREVLFLIEDINRSKPEWEVIGFLDDGPLAGSASVRGLPILGGRDWLRRTSRKVHVVFGLSSPRVKREVALTLAEDVAGFPKLIHPSVIRSENVELGEGVVVTAGNILTTDIYLGDHTLLNLMCTVGHDVVLHDYASVAPGVNVSGCVEIGAGCEIGTGAKIIQNITIGEWSVVGAGAVVTSDLPANCTAVGVPAKVIKQWPAGWHNA
jgi:sugar O-acyltransferase (sialic acid O-acetyltransferase NeuD family)